MTVAIASLTYDSTAGRIMVSCSADATVDSNLKLYVDGVAQPGVFISGAYGYVYQHTDAIWGCPAAAGTTHSVRVTYSTTISTTTQSIVAPAPPPPPPPPAPTYSFVYSSSSTRTNPVPMDGATVKGSVYPFITPTTNVAKVAFALDGVAVRTESIAPFDFGGTASPGGATDPANPWDTTKVADGSHTLGAAVTLSDGTTQAVTAKVTVSNGVVTPPPPPTGTTDKNRFNRMLGIAQSPGGPKSITDAINDTPNHHAKLVRLEVFIPSGGNFDFTSIGAKLAAAKAKGLSVMILTSYIPTDCWAPFTLPNGKTYSSYPTGGHTFPRTGPEQDRYVSYVKKLLTWCEQNYPGLVVAVENSNEPQGWEFGAASGTLPFLPAQFVSYSKKLGAMMRASFPNILHILGGCSPSNTNGDDNNGYTGFSPRAWGTNKGWFAELKRLGLQWGTDFDHIASHFYDSSIDATWSNPFNDLWTVWGVTNADGTVSGPQVWATEQSASSSPNDGNSTSTEDTQNSWWSNNLSLWAGKGAKAGVFFAFCCYDRNTTDKFGYFGLSKSDGTRKKSFFTFAAKNGLV